MPAASPGETERKPARETRTPASTRVAKAQARSRVSNGADILPGVDGRSIVARRFRDIVAAIVVDQGGPDQISEAREQLIRRFAAAAVLAEQLEAQLAMGEEIDINQHALLCSSLVRLAQRIGIDRRMRNVVPTLAEYIATKQQVDHAEVIETSDGDDDDDEA